MIDRESILDAEYIRETPGLRPFSVGILRLCRELGLAIANPGAADSGEAGRARELLTIAWLLDSRNHLSTVRAAVAGPREDIEATLDEYEFKVGPALLAGVRKEITITQRAVAAAAYEVEAKPGESGGAAPLGKP